MRAHSQPRAHAGAVGWISAVLDLTQAVGTGSWEGRREEGTTPSGSSQHSGRIKHIMKPHLMLLRLLFHRGPGSGSKILMWKGRAERQTRCLCSVNCWLSAGAVTS